MNTRNILIVSAHPGSLSQWSAAYDTVVAPTDEAAIELAQRQHFEAIVIDDTDAQLHGAKLRAILPILQPDAAFFHYEQGAPVQTAVQEHFRRQRNERIRRFVVIGDGYAADEATPGFSAN